MKLMQAILKRRKVLVILSIICVLFLVVFGFREKSRRSHQFVSVFSPMVVSTDKALLEFGQVDEGYIKGQETQENYANGWYELNYRLKIIKSYEDDLGTPPREFEGLVANYRAGLDKVLGVSNDVVDYYNGYGDPETIIRNREKFEEGLKLLRKVKDRLTSTEEEV